MARAGAAGVAAATAAFRLAVSVLMFATEASIAAVSLEAAAAAMVAASEEISGWLQSQLWSKWPPPHSGRQSLPSSFPFAPLAMWSCRGASTRIPQSP